MGIVVCVCCVDCGCVLLLFRKFGWLGFVLYVMGCLVMVGFVMLLVGG